MNKNIQKTIQIISMASIAIVMSILVFTAYTNVHAQTTGTASLDGDPEVRLVPDTPNYKLYFTLSFSDLENDPYEARANLTRQCRLHKSFNRPGPMPVNVSSPTSYFLKSAPGDLTRVFTCNAEVQIKTSASSAWTTLNTVVLEYSYAPQDTDEDAPELSDESSIGIINDDESEFTFTSNEAGTITYGGSCGSDTTEAEAGENTVTLKKRITIEGVRIKLLKNSRTEPMTTVLSP